MLTNPKPFRVPLILLIRPKPKRAFQLLLIPLMTSSTESTVKQVEENGSCKTKTVTAFRLFYPQKQDRIDLSLRGKGSLSLRLRAHAEIYLQCFYKSTLLLCGML